MGEVANIPQLRFPEFSNEWEESKVGKVFKVSAGGDIKTENVSQIKTDGFPYPIYANAEKAKGLYGYSNLYKSEANVVTVAGRGVNIGIAHVRLEPFYPIVRLLVLNPIKDADVKFWENQLNQLNLFVESTGVPQLTAPQISSYKVKYPSKPEQQKIAAFLTAVDNKIEQLSKKQELLSEYKKGLMQKIFSQAIRFKADDGSDFPDWEDGLLNTLIDNSRKIRYGIVQPGKYDKNGKYLIRGKDYSNGWEIPSEFFKVSDAIEKKYSKTRVKKGDVIVCIVGSVGNVMVIPGWLDGANITQTTARIAPDKNKLNNQYLYFYFQSLVGRNMIHKHTRVGTRPGLNIEDVEKFSILLPSLLEQAKIANFLSSIDNKIEQVGKQLDESKQFKKALLQQMFV